MLKAAYLNQSREAGIARVYDEPTQAAMEGLFRLSSTVYTKEDVLADRLSDVEAIFSTWGFPVLTDAEIAAHLPHLKIVFYGAGSVQAFARPLIRNGVTVVSAWMANSVPVIEYTVAQIILANKGYFGASRLCSRSLDSRRAATEHFHSFRGNYDTPVGLIGLGAIGAGVAERLKGFRLKVYAYDPYCSAEKAAALGVEPADLDFIFETCLTVSNHTPNIPSTKGMLTYAHFSRMPPNGVFINTGRGAQVVEADLIRALAEEPARTAVLDVTDPEPSVEGHPFYEMENVILTPHIAGSAGAECYRMGAYMAEEARRYLAGEPLRYAVTEQMLETMA
jgi:phosphoglycerate dehydrogenase-like enzyme